MTIGQMKKKSLLLSRVATVRENFWKIIFFPGQGKIREFCGWSGKFGKSGKSQGI